MGFLIVCGTGLCGMLTFGASENDDMQEQFQRPDICAGDKGTCPGGRYDATTPIYLQNISTEELNVQATNYILSLLEHHIPTAAASIDKHLDELPLVVTLAVIVCIIVTRIVFVGILLGLIVGFICGGPIVLVARCYYHLVVSVSEKNDVGNMPVSTASAALDLGVNGTCTDGRDDINDEDDKVDEFPPPAAEGEKALRFAPGTKCTDGTSRGNNVRRRRRRKKI